MDKRTIKSTIMELVEARGTEKTICPSEAARALADDWRPLMDEVRAAAGELAADGRLDIVQKGRKVDLETVKGPIRLRLRRKHPRQQ